MPPNPQIGKTCRFMLMAMLIGLFVAGCTAATERLHPQFPAYRHAMGVMLVLDPEIGIYEKLPDGSRMYHEAHSHDAQRIAQQAIVRQLRDRQFSVLTVNADTLAPGEMMSIASLFRSVNRSIQLHTFGPQHFPAKITAFEYNLGPVADILKTNGADGLVLALGHQSGIERPARNWLSIAVVEPEGRIIWYGIQGDHERFNIQDEKGLHALVASTLANFWEQGS